MLVALIYVMLVALIYVMLVAVLPPNIIKITLNLQCHLNTINVQHHKQFD
mgnify:CR=1 FL=1